MFRIFKNLRIWALVTLLCLSLSWSLPAQAAQKIDPKVEQRVLQIIRKNS
jgi:hypothetical protein